MNVAPNFIELEFIIIPPNETHNIYTEMTPLKKYRIVTMETHSLFNLYFKGEESLTREKITLTHTNNGFDKNSETIKGASAKVEIINKSDITIGIIASSPDSELIQKTIAEYPHIIKPFVSGKMMLNNQTFRDLFLVDNLPNNLSLKINDITLLFTDLKGSTELYDKTGDVYAYKLVQEHFRILQKIVDLNKGGIVKTMSDAIMASFNTLSTE